MRYKASIFALLTAFFLWSCIPEVPVSKKNYTLLIVLAPIETPDTQVSSVQTNEKNNPEQSQSSQSQLDLSVEFIDYIKKYLLLPGNKYEYKGICNNGLQYQDSTEYYPNSKIKGVIPEDNLYQFLRDAKNKDCRNSPETLLSLIHLIGEYTKQNPKSELIIVAQTPWKNIDNRTKANLKQEVENIRNKKNIKKIFLWGNKDNNLTDIFSIFNQTDKVVDSSGSNLPGIENKIKELGYFLQK